MRALPLFGWLALAGLTVTPPSLLGSAGPEASAFDGRVGVARVALPRLGLGSPLVPRDRIVLSGGWPFGGLSALAVSPGGDRLIALADTGRTVTLHPDWRASSWSATIRFLPDRLGDAPGKAARDSESLAQTDDGWWIGFESINELRHYPPDFSAVVGGFRSPALCDLPATLGLESLAALPDGRLLGIAETVGADGRARVFVWTRAGGRIVAERLAWFRPPAGYRATDAVALDRHRLLVLVRRFAVPEGFTSALMLVPLTPTPGFGENLLTGAVVARFGDGADNAEGLALSHEGGRPMVWIVSDDNLSPLQRTVLTRYWWADPTRPSR